MTLSQRSRSFFWSLLLTILGLGVATASCLPVSPAAFGEPHWLPADLRLLDPPDAGAPDQDLIALYTRHRGDEIQVRLDLLDLQPSSAFDLYIALDTAPGGQLALPLEEPAGLRWDLLLVFPAAGGPRVYNPGMQPRADILPRLVRLPTQGTIEISLNAQLLSTRGRPFSLQVFLASPGSFMAADRLEPVETDRILRSRAPVLLAFWNVFPAYTPAQALRRWDGAHTGPYGERHGLANLLAVAGRHRAPLLLADAKNPAALSALDFLGKTGELRSAAASGRVTLPDTLPVTLRLAGGEYPFRIPDPLLLEAIKRGRVTAQAYGIRPSSILYSPWPLSTPPPEYRMLVTHAPQGLPGTPDPPVTRLARWREVTLLEIPAPAAEPQLTKQGFPVEVRRALLMLALDPLSAGSLDDSRLMALGGDLTSSAWGDPQAAEAGLAYLASHPWIRLLGAGDLLAANPALSAEPALPLPALEFIPFLRPGLPLPGGRTAEDWAASLIAALTAMPPGPMRDLALDSAISLAAPNPPEEPELALLQASQLSQVGWLLAAAEWAADPGDLSTCSTDPDQDGLPECILASERLFALIEPQGAELKVLFSLVDGRADQWIGPSSQFVVGVSDPAQWDLALGPAADPAAFQGAFRDFGDPLLQFKPRLLSGGLAFTTPDGGLTKQYQINQDRLQVRYQAQPARALALEVPLIVPPAARQSPGWADTLRMARHPEGLSWGLAGGPVLELHASAISLHTFIDSRTSLTFPEDPNQNFPEGHFLPFPFALAQVTGFGDLTVDLVVSR